MKKEAIHFPDKIIWTEERTISERDINYARHLGNDRILVWADEIRLHALENIGWTRNRLAAGEGLIVANHTIVYQSEGFLGDVIGVEVGIDFLTECSFDMVLRLKKKGASRNLIIMRTGLVCFDYEKRKIIEIPKEFYEQLSE